MNEEAEIQNNNLVSGEISESDLLKEVSDVSEAAKDVPLLPKGHEIEENLLSKKDKKDDKEESIYFEEVEKEKESEYESASNFSKGDEPQIYKTGKKIGQHKKSCTCNDCKLKIGEKVETKESDKKEQQDKKQDNKESLKIDPIAHLLNAPIAFVTKRLFKSKKVEDTIFSFEQQQFFLQFQPEIKEYRSWWWYFPILITTAITNFITGNKATSFSYGDKK